MTNDLHRRCQVALTHPLTVGALGVLLLNDVVLKPLLPGHVVTGKVSDLAWVVFAPPLLAFLISCLIPRSRLAERSVFAIAYVGLPLLYAAFNTFERVHDWVMRGLLLLSGGTAGSPLDPTDSLVIPFGLALALWVWRQTLAAASPRLRLHLFVAVVASLATVATSVEPPSRTAWFMGVGGDGTLVFEGPHRDYYESVDGGMTWSFVSPGQVTDVEWGGTRVEAPRGEYLITGSDIVLRISATEFRRVYSNEYLREESNLWAQRYSTRELRSDLTSLYDDPESLVVTRPVNIVHDERTGNVVASMGLQGVIVGDSAEQWTRVGVGGFTPTDFSLVGKTRLMLLSPGFWLVSMAVSLSLIAVSLALTEARPASAPPRWAIIGRRVTGTALLLVVLVIILVWVSILFGSDLVLSPLGRVASYMLMTLPFALLVYMFMWPRQGTVRRIFAMIFAIVGIVLSAAGFPPYAGDAMQGLTDFDLQPIYAICGLTCALVAVALYWPATTRLRASALALAAMNASVVLPIVLWLAGGLPLIGASLASLVLLILTAYTLGRYLVRRSAAIEP